MWKNKTYSFLNIFGLAIGITCAGLIFLWVEDEVNFNHNFANISYVYHVMQNEPQNGSISTTGSTPGPLAKALKAEMPGVENAGRLSWAMDELAVAGDKSIKVNGIYADTSILSILSIPFVYGDAGTAFKQLQSVIISESFAKKFFGSDANAMGKTLKMAINGSYSVDGLYAVTGVYKDLPKNCYYHFDWVTPYLVWENANTWVAPWTNSMSETLVQLSPAADANAVNNKIKNLLATKMTGNQNTLFLFSMKDWNLRSNFENGKQVGGNIRYVRLFTLIAVIILLIACINFMNLATAHSEQRAKEVGVLKVVGVLKGGLIGKFIAESLIMSYMAVLLAIALLYVLMPAYNGLVNKQLSVGIVNPLHIFSLLGLGLLAGLVAGSYPAFYLSSFKPVMVLKGMKLKSSMAAVFIRKGLVITQFTVSIILIISTVVIYQQVQHIKSRDIGYNKNNAIYMDMQGSMKKSFLPIKDMLLATGYVQNAATSLHNSLRLYSSSDGFTWPGKDPSKHPTVHYNVVSPEYVSTMGMQLINGRDFYGDGSDSVSIVINQSMAALMGKAGTVGATVVTGGGQYKLHVVGIIKNFLYNDMYGTTDPALFMCGTYNPTELSIRFKPNVDLTQALEKTEAVFKKENPGYPFEYKFFDETFNQLFATETLIGKLAGVFAVLAIFISCLGLFGLAAYTAERRSKEIGIRKVLGASVQGLAALLSKEFIQLVAVSCIVAFPVSWWAMHVWLQDYAYRTTIQWWVFAVAGIAALAIALVTVSFQAVKAALANPVRSLRSE